MASEDVKTSETWSYRYLISPHLTDLSLSLSFGGCGSVFNGGWLFWLMVVSWFWLKVVGWSDCGCEIWDGLRSGCGCEICGCGWVSPAPPPILVVVVDVVVFCVCVCVCVGVDGGWWLICGGGRWLWVVAVDLWVWVVEILCVCVCVYICKSFFKIILMCWIYYFNV